MGNEEYEIMFLETVMKLWCKNIFLQRKKHGAFSENIYLIKVNDKNTRKRCKICSKLTIKIPE